MTDATTQLPDRVSGSRLDSRTALELSGPDTTSFLHAQLTSDVESQGVRSVSWSAWLTPKGRVISTLLIARLESERYLLIVPVSLAETLKKRLKMFVLRSKVEISEQVAEHYTVAGEAASEWLASNALPTGAVIETADGLAMHIGPPPTAATDGVQESARDDSANAGEAVYCLNREDPTVDPTHTSVSDETDWNDWCIARALPWIESRTSEGFIPQSLNLDAIGGLSYDKGCYPGQEIVARTHFKGRLKYRTAILNFDAAPGVSAGDKITEAGDGGRSATVLITGHHQALVVVPVGWLENESNRLTVARPDRDEAMPVTIAPPPYSLPAG